MLTRSLSWGMAILALLVLVGAGKHLLLPLWRRVGISYR
jgi:hypothetical protein